MITIITNETTKAAWSRYFSRQAAKRAADAPRINFAEIISAGLAGKNDLVKVLGNGELTAALTVTAHAFSKSAIAKIEAAGGKAVVIE